jgi:ABC-type transporter MlaC component
VRYTIEKQDGHLKAEMVERDTAEETAEFVEAIVQALRAGPVDKLLVSIRDSRPVFRVEQWRLSAALDQVMSIPGLKVAFIAELQMSQQYIALLGRQRGLQFEAFESEAAARAWLTSASSA